MADETPKKIKQQLFLKTYKKAIFAVILLSAAVCVFFFVALPFYGTYQENQDLIDAENQKIETLDVRIAQLEKVRRLASTIDTNSTLAKQAVTEKDEIPVVMAMVQEISKNSGVQITTFSYAGMAKSEVGTATTPVQTGVTEVTDEEALNETAPTQAPVNPADTNDAFKLSIQVNGKFNDIVRYVKALENSRRILDITNFEYSIQRDSDQIVSDVLTLKMNLTSYFKQFNVTSGVINLEQYNPLISKLEQFNYTEIDLSNINVGKVDPFSQNQDETEGVDVNTVQPNQSNNETSGEFFNEEQSEDLGINVVEIEGTGSNNEQNTQQDVEAQEGDLTETLQQLLQQEGL